MKNENVAHSHNYHPENKILNQEFYGIIKICNQSK